MRFARIVLAIEAVVMLGLSLAYWIWPYEMANLNGMLLMETASVSHMRVYYGGLQLGLALFLLWSMRDVQRIRPALVLLVFTMLALVIGRLGSLLLDGGELIGFDLASLIYRLVAALLAGIAWLLVRRDVAPEVESDENDGADPEPLPQRVEPPTRRLFDEPPKPFRVGEVPPDAELAPRTSPSTADASAPGGAGVHTWDPDAPGMDGSNDRPDGPVR